MTYIQKEKVWIIIETLFSIPVWIISGAWGKTRDGISGAIDAWKYLR